MTGRHFQRILTALTTAAGSKYQRFPQEENSAAQNRSNCLIQEEWTWLHITFHRVAITHWLKFFLRATWLLTCLQVSFVKGIFLALLRCIFFGGEGGGELLLNVYSVHPTLVPTRAPFSPYMMPCFIETGNVRHRRTLAENAHSWRDLARTAREGRTPRN